MAPPLDAALASFVLLAQFLGTPAEAAQIHHDRGQGDRPYSFDDLTRIARKLGLIARRKRSGIADLPKLPLPALVALRDGGAAILLKVDDTADTGNRHMILRPDTERPEIWSEEEVAAQFALIGEQADLLLMTSREHVAGDRRAFEFQQWMLLPVLERMGPRLSIALERHGFYPRTGAGGSSSRSRPRPSRLSPASIVVRSADAGWRQCPRVSRPTSPNAAGKALPDWPDDALLCAPYRWSRGRVTCC